MGKKIIRLTEEDLKEIVQNVTKDILTEMAVPIKVFKSRVDNLRLQLVENWCLCRYCQLFSPNNENFNHWIIELRAHMNNIKSLNIKKGNKLNILKQMFIDDYDFDDVNTICRIVIDKFEREGITDINQISKVCSNFTDLVINFVNALGVDTIRTDVYLNNTFKK